MKRIFISIVVSFGLFTLAACQDDAATASRNLSVAADNFEIERKIVFLNGITNEYMAVMEGFCSIEPKSGRLEVICRVGPDEYEKHFLGLSDNVTYFAMQTETANVSAYHNRIIWKPQSIIPDIDIKFDGEELLTNQNEDG